MRITLSVVKVIALLEAKLVELNKWPEKEAKYAAEIKEWEARAVATAKEHGKIITVTVFDRGDVHIHYKVKLPAKPKALVSPVKERGNYWGNNVDTAKDEITTALKFLRMTEKTEVSMSALKDVADYL